VSAGGGVQGLVMSFLLPLSGQGWRGMASGLPFGFRRRGGRILVICTPPAARRAGAF